MGGALSHMGPSSISLYPLSAKFVVTILRGCNLSSPVCVVLNLQSYLRGKERIFQWSISYDNFLFHSFNSLESLVALHLNLIFEGNRVWSNLPF